MSDRPQGGNKAMEGRINPWEGRKKPVWESTLEIVALHLNLHISPTEGKAAWLTRQGAGGRHGRPDFCSCYHQARDAGKLQH